MEFGFDIPDELQKQLSVCADIDRIAPKMLEAAAPIVVEAIKQRAPVDMGGLKKHVKAMKPKRTKDGAWICNINFTGKDESGVNMIKAVAAEYGTSKRRAKPFIRPAVDAIKDDANAKMQEIFNEEVGK